MGGVHEAMKLSQITLAAQIFEILNRASRPLKVRQINHVLANSSWRGKYWYADGVSRQRTTQLLRRMRARGLTRRTSSGWRTTRNAPAVVDLREFVITLEAAPKAF